MKITIEKGSGFDTKTKALVIPMFKEQMTTQLENLDRELYGAIKELVSSKEFKGELNEIAIIHTYKKIKPEKIVLVGLGDEKKFQSDFYRQAAGKATAILRKKEYEEFTATGIKDVQLFVEGIILANYEFDKHLSKKKKKVKQVTLFVDDTAKAKKEANKGRILANAQNFARDLSNETDVDGRPENIARAIKKMAIKAGLKITIYNEKQLQKYGFGGTMAVGKGSANPPRFVILDNKKKGKPIVLVGKGICYDTGGINVKTAVGGHMEFMQHDKAGASAVAAAMKAISELKINQHVIALLPFAENMSGADAYKPTDIVKTFDGQTVEVWNTDAEGRMVLADALGYAKDLKPEVVIDIATLTGSSTRALGAHFSAIMGTDQKTIDALIKSGAATGEYSWQFPLLEEYEDYIKGDRGDFRNLHKGDLGSAGHMKAGAFLKQFTDYPWVHIDMTEGYKTGDGRHQKEPFFPKHATGWGARLLTDFVENYKGK